MTRAAQARDYSEYFELEFSFQGTTIPVISKPGLPDWDSLLPSESLLMEHARPAPEGRTLLLGCHHGAAAVFWARLAAPSSEILVADSSWLALACTKRSLERNHLAHVQALPSLDLYPAFLGEIDTVIMLPPRGRAQGRAWLALSAELIKPGGQLYLAGANDEGIQSLIKDAADLFGTCITLAYRRGSRAAVSTHSGQPNVPDWVNLPGTRPGTFRTQEINLDSGQSFIIHSLPGVFSQEHLDSGSRLLLDHLPGILDDLPAGGSILDVGCGYGILGMAAARYHPTGQVTMVDIDLPATRCAQLNLAANQITNASVFPSDLLDGCANQRYHLILSNPPFHAGKQVSYSAAHALIAQAHTHLLPGGALVLVANRFLRYEKTMQEVFPRVEVIAENRQYHLLRASLGGRQHRL